MLLILTSCTKLGKVEVGEVVIAGAAGGSHGVALSETGRVWHWGGTRRVFPTPALTSTCSGRPVGKQNDLLEPELVEDLDGVVAVAAGGNYSLALKENGQVLSWGSTLLEKRRVERVERVEGLPPVVSISAGGTHAAAVTEEGEVWVWGLAKGWGGKGEVGRDLGLEVR